MSTSIAQQELIRLAAEYGAPLYVYDAQTMRRQYRKLEDAFKECQVKIHYAMKALSNIHVLQLFRELGAGLDAVSLEEVRIGLLAGYPPEDILYTPNCVSFAEIEECVALGVKLNIDNISILEQFGHRYGASVPVCIRVNPHIMAGGHYKISTGHIDSKFGISIHQMRHVERLISSLGIKVEGIHMHTGSDILDVDVFLNGAELLFDLALSFPDIAYIDFGSGFKVGYKPDDVTTDVALLGKRLTERYQRFCKEYGREIQIHFEPGKFLVSEAGYFLAKVNVIKQTTATVFAGLDTGFNHLMRPTLYDAYHHITNLSHPHGRQRVYTVVGYICETDTFAWDRPLKEVREGDLLCFHNAGAYGFMMASNYNSRLRPAEVLVDGDTDKLIRRRETLDDLLATQL
ncbi:diaminopimelate decarboxylase [Taibaiella koreensis]|uniref:diaminopimelate decarboxylase n=1 Tax=Taibaiella koreensis TaxID=1268548 RepID=UPI000E59F952|nr:diaminopimelate decarboxylase [Taibaiella koreensis]